MTRVYEEIVDFIAAGTTADEVAEWSPSLEARELVESLVNREKNGQLSPEEAVELQHYLELEHLMRLAKARARQCRGHE